MDCAASGLSTRKILTPFNSWYSSIGFESGIIDFSQFKNKDSKDFVASDSVISPAIKNLALFGL